MPPRPAEPGSDRVGDEVSPVTGGVIEEVRAGDLGDEAPDHEMEGKIIRLQNADENAQAELA
mgnify:CR=1 FL=1